MMEVRELGVASEDDDLRCVLLVGMERDEEEGGRCEVLTFRMIGG